MGKNKKSGCPYTGIEPGLSVANREIIGWNRPLNHWKKTTVEKIFNQIVRFMKQQSPLVFAKLSPKIFGGGSSFEGLKADPNGDFDMYILLQIPAVTKPVLIVDTEVHGYVQLQLQNFDALKRKNPELHKKMSEFVDNDKYILTTEWKSKLMQSTFDQTRNTYFPDGIITVRNEKYEITRVQKSESPAFALTIEGLTVNLSLKIDLVSGIFFSGDQWPKGAFRSNPFRKPSEFFIVPKEPKHYVHPHFERYFRLSFQKQERVIINDRMWLKPTIRIMKLIKKHFDHDVSSYAIKTLCMRELLDENSEVMRDTPAFWKGPFSNCLVTMLEKYLECLKSKGIWYFWSEKLNLLDNLSKEQLETYSKDIERMLKDVKDNPDEETILGYLEINFLFV